MAALASSFLIESSSFVQVMRTCINACMSLYFCPIPPLITELFALENLKMIYSLVVILVPSFLFESSSFLKVTRRSIKSRKSLNFGQI